MGNILKTGFAVLFVGLGLALPQAYSGEMEKEKGMMEGKMMAMLEGAGGHQAAGTVAIKEGMKGSSSLVMTDFKVDKVPDGRVYLAKDGDYTKGVELGKLKQFSGTVEYPIPANVNPQDYNSVVIWCKKFSVEIGHATFTMMDKGEEMMK